MKQHRCAVCWERLASHDDWLQHATVVHGAVLAEFGYSVCSHDRSCRSNCREHASYNCPGTQHVRRFKTEGEPIRRSRPEPQPFVARDGTTYTPVRLPL